MASFLTPITERRDREKGSHCCSRLLLPFGRGSAGCVAIDNGDSTWSVTFRKSLPSDAYRYAIRGKGSPVLVVPITSGKLTATVPAWRAMATHTVTLDSGSGPGKVQAAVVLARSRLVYVRRQPRL
ncbi:hypothetical protein DFH06DRAFT_1166883 [Mycena polygramma]|nr:hypothetical protein DFH06DRAFT_1166883 [Mycena polygramma]